MPHQFRPARRRAVSAWMLGIMGLVVVGGIFELYRWVVPFQTANPLWHEVTIGEPVIDDWQYWGKDEEGYLKFMRQGQSPVLLPPNSHMFDADGKFVVIESATPSTLVFAEPYQAIPLSWLLGGLGAVVIGVTALVVILRRRRQLSLIRGRAQLRRPRIIIARFRIPSRVKRFTKRTKTR